jgi:prefoldin beta subunit
MREFFSRLFFIFCKSKLELETCIDKKNEIIFFEKVFFLRKNKFNEFLKIMSNGVDAEIMRIYQAIQAGMQGMRDLQLSKTKSIESLNKLIAQRNENELVKTELTHLEPGACVYKLVGPALVSQDTEDAKHVVGRRLEHIASEIVRTEKLIADTEKKEDEQREQIVGLQRQIQARSAALEQKKE